MIGRRGSCTRLSSHYPSVVLVQTLEDAFDEFGRHHWDHAPRWVAPKVSQPPTVLTTFC